MFKRVGFDSIVSFYYNSILLFDNSVKSLFLASNCFYNYSILFLSFSISFLCTFYISDILSFRYLFISSNSYFYVRTFTNSYFNLWISGNDVSGLISGLFISSLIMTVYFLSDIVFSFSLISCNYLILLACFLTYYFNLF